MQADPQQETTAEGIVTEALPNAMFRIRLDGSDEETIAYLAGKMKMHRIRVLIGDRVKVDLDPYGGKHRISRRL